MGVYAAIADLAIHLPNQTLTNEALAEVFPKWTPDKIAEKTGIHTRCIAAENETSADLAYAAGSKLLASLSPQQVERIDYVLFCTQSPDYFLPTSACILQHRLGLPTHVGAIDFNQGCSGYIYGLGLAKGLIETGQARSILFLTGETYSKFINHQDGSVRTLFGDGAAATLIVVQEADAPLIGPFIYGSDGSGADSLIVPNGGARKAVDAEAELIENEDGHVRTANELYMDGAAVFNFANRVVPQAIDQILKSTDLTLDDVDYFVFHQANQFMLEHLRRKLKIAPEKFAVVISQYGNTVSSTIPIALHDLKIDRKIEAGARVLLVGFGVGLSWGCTFVRWT